MGCHCKGSECRDRLVEEAAQDVLSSMDMREVLERIGRILVRHFGMTRISIHRVSPADPSRLELLVVVDPRSTVPPAAGATLPMDGSAAGRAIADRRPLVLERLDPANPRYGEEGPLALAGYGALVCFPLEFDGEIIGTLDIAHEPRTGLLDRCMDDASRVARLAAIALHNSRMMEEVRRLNALLDRENSLLKDQISETRSSASYVAESAIMREVLSRVRMVATSPTTVLVRGETGTGKEGLARLVHDWSDRFAGPFVVVNVGAIPESLIESELFGHEKGAFTGATSRRAGKFERARGGTIFLDEIGDAPPAVQVKLLRALQEREVQPVGGAEAVPVDVRVVAATNRPLERMLEEGTFRSDLYYRLNMFPIHLPPLRERREDVRPLASHFLERHATAMHRRPPSVPEDAWRALESYDWPGNVRELDNFVGRALILSRGPALALPDLPRAAEPPGGAGAGSGGRADAGGRGTGTVPRFDDAVRDLIGRALEASEGRIYGARGAAALLGLKPTTLQGKIRKYMG